MEYLKQKNVATSDLNENNVNTCSVVECINYTNKLQ